jgi:hypothetical protein
MTNPTIGRISRISFLTDMTRADASVLPLGFMLEAAWPDQARWLGLIGRTRLTPLELDRVNLTTWPDLRAPFNMLDKLFDQGWQSEWGGAGVTIQKQWSRSAFAIDIDDYPLKTFSADTAEAWASTCEALCASLNALHVRLAPVLVAPLIPLRAPKAPAVARPIDIRTRAGAPEAMAA